MKYKFYFYPFKIMSLEEYDQLLVTSHFTEAMNITRSEIEPGSVSEVSKVPSNQPASTVVSTDGYTFSTSYLDFQISPIVGDVCDLSRSYIYVDYTVRHGIAVGGQTYSDVYILEGVTEAAGTFSKIQVSQGMQMILDDQYNFLHAAICAKAALASETEHSHEYATIDSMLRNKTSPMRLVKIPKTTLTWADHANAYKEYLYEVNFSYSIDLNRLTIMLSNMYFTTVFDNEMKVSVWFLNALSNFHYMVLPSESSLSVGSNVYFQKGADDNKTIVYQQVGVQNGNGILTVNPIRWGNAPPDSASKLIDFGDRVEWISIPLPICTKTEYLDTGGGGDQQHTKPYVKQTTLVTSYVPNAAIQDNDNGVGIPSKISSDGSNVTRTKDWGEFLSIPIMFTLSKGANAYNYQVNEAYIFQYTFRLKPSAFQRLHEMFSNTGYIVRPVQVIESTPFVSSVVGPNSGAPNVSINTTMNTNNVTHVIVSNTPNAGGIGNGCLINHFKTQYQLYVNGVPLNQIPYIKSTNGRVIKDYVNAICDTDNEEINNDYLYSLSFPGYTNPSNGGGPAYNAYFFAGDFHNMKRCNWNSAQKVYYKQPNGYFDVWATSQPSSFMTGLCVAPKSKTQLQFTLTSTYTSYNDMNDEERYQPTLQKQGDGSLLLASDKALTLPSYLDRECITWVSCISDACIYMKYDPSIRQAISANRVPVYPFADGTEK